MKYPGGFLEFQDYNQDNVNRTIYGTYNISLKYQDTAFATISCGVDTPDIITSVTFNSGIPTGFGDLSRIVRRRLLWDNYQRFIQDTIDFYQYYTLVLHRSDIEARLPLEWACYSPKTIFTLKVLYGTSPLKQRAFGHWINEHSAVKFVWDKLYGGFVPKALRRKYWNYNFNKYMYEYVWTRVETIQDYINRSILRTYTPPVSGLLPYNARATSSFSFLRHPEDKTEQFYGIELEYENYSTSVHSRLSELLSSFCILKRDGSLSNGVEICSAPAHFDIHKKEIEPFFKELPSLQLLANDHCGFHIHTSRQPLSFLQLGKIFAFINNTENDELIYNIAGRSENTYCRATSVRYQKSYPFSNGYGPDRYRRLNLTNNDTIEFRIFSTPTTYDNFMYKMEFCKSLIDYSKPGEVSISRSEHGDNYLEYVYKNRYQYTHLWKHLLTSGV